jgi:transcriptional regulator with XRE-family HTH domain
MTNSPLPPYKALREACGLTQRAVERALGWSTGRLSVIERGLVPTDEERRQLLAFLNDRLTEATQEVPLT